MRSIASPRFSTLVTRPLTHAVVYKQYLQISLLEGANVNVSFYFAPSPPAESVWPDTQ